MDGRTSPHGSDAKPIQIDDFLNPASMITPAVAGAFVFSIANAILAAFADISFRVGVLTLALSFLVGLLVAYGARAHYKKQKTPWFIRGVYFVLNSLVIFATATGTATVGAKTGTLKADVGALLRHEAAAQTPAPRNAQSAVQMSPNLATWVTGPPRPATVLSNRSPFQLQSRVTPRAPTGMEKAFVSVGLARPKYTVELWVSCQGSPDCGSVRSLKWLLDEKQFPSKGGAIPVTGALPALDVTASTAFPAGAEITLADGRTIVLSQTVNPPAAK